jgi:hypothetical protein
MARLRRLETATGRRRGEQAEEDLHEATRIGRVLHHVVLG